MSLGAVILLLLTTAQSCWANLRVQSEVLESDKAMTCLSNGHIRGKSVLGLCLWDESFLLVWFEGSEWRTERIKIDFYPTHLKFLQGRNDGITRLYVASRYSGKFMEFTPRGSGDWDAQSYDSHGGTENLGAGVSLEDGKARLYFTRMVASRQVLPPQLYQDPGFKRCGVPADFALMECVWERGTWKCRDIGTTCPSPLLVNPWPRRFRYDMVIGNQIFVRRSGKWQELKNDTRRRNLIAAEEPGTIYHDAGESRFEETVGSSKIRPFPIEFSSTQLTFYGGGFDEVSGAFRAMGYGRLGRESAPRLFAADEDHLYEFRRSTAAWKIASSQSLSIRPDFLLTAAVRKDGLNRLYMVANDRKGRSLVYEYSPVSRRVSVAAQDFRFDSPKRETWMAETERILGDVFRSELSRLENVALLDSENMWRIIEERDFQDRFCDGPECSRRWGRDLKADVLIVNRIAKGKDGYSIKTKALDTISGATLFMQETKGIQEEMVMEAAAAQVRHCSRLWPL